MKPKIVKSDIVSCWSLNEALTTVQIPTDFAFEIQLWRQILQKVSNPDNCSFQFSANVFGDSFNILGRKCRERVTIFCVLNADKVGIQQSLGNGNLLVDPGPLSESHKFEFQIPQEIFAC